MKRSLLTIIATLVVLAAVLGLVAAGCSSGSAATTTSAGSQVTTATTQASTLTTSNGSMDTTATAGSDTTTAPAGNSTSGTTTPTVVAQGAASPAEAVAQKLGPSVVNIKVTGTTPASDNGFPFGQQTPQEYSAEGSGVIYRADGMIITNNHVVTDEYTGDPVDTIKVTLATGEELDATLVGRDPLTDLAVIKVKTDKQLPVAGFVGALPQVGEYAVAIGSPLGYENSVTLGIVSGLSRQIEGITGAESAAYTNLIQTDAPISPGNSGGALANAGGQVIGINVAYEPPSQTGAVSIGFAIPASTVVNVADQLINSGKVVQGYLGVSLYPDPLDATIKQHFSLSRDSGVLVSEIVPAGPAEKAGLKQGDIVFKANGATVTDPSAFIALIRDMKPGSQVELTIDRDGKELTVTVTIGERPSTTATTSQ